MRCRPSEVQVGEAVECKVTSRRAAGAGGCVVVH